MTQKKVIIIGGGMAGLSAGNYLRMNGYETTIFEMNSAPGGLCTSWDRGKYKVDLCIHWLDNPKQYEIEKKRIAEELIELLDKRFGNIKGNIEMVDVSTPVTFKKFLRKLERKF